MVDEMSMTALQSQPQVHIVKLHVTEPSALEPYAKYDLAHRLKSALNKIRWHKIIKTGAKVTIKVNGTHFVYLPGLTTTPELVYQLVSILRTRASEVIVGEADLQRVNADIALHGTGIKAAAERAGATVVNLSRTKMQTIKLDGEWFKSIKLASVLVDCDVFVSMPLFKTHKITGVSLTLKNQFGCIPDDMRLIYHGQINKTLVDLERLLAPKLIVMDGIIGLESDGPIAGLPKELGIILLGTNSVATDAVACRIMGINPEEIAHIRYAHERGLGPIDLNAIRLSGIALQEVTTPFERANQDAISYLEKWIAPHPILSKLVYKTFFNTMKWCSWKVRTLTGYKSWYISRIKARKLWDNYQYQSLFV